MPKGEPAAIHTDFNSVDALRGDEQKLNKAMDLAASRTGRGGLVELYMCCAPMIVAGDISAVTDRASREKGAEVLVEDYNDYNQMTPGKVKARARFIARKLKAAGAKKASKDINLVGFGRHREALASLLSERGLSVRTPGPDFYGDILGSRLQVLSEPDAERIEAFDSSSVKWVSPEAPYGFGRTRAWIKSLFSALGSAPGADPGSGKALSAEMKKLSAEAAEFRVGFVVPQGEIGLLEGSSATSMVPVIPFLCEAGFAIKLFVYAPGKEERRKAALALSAF
ncbi:MAG: nitrogenase component 1, partial [Elusimicrobiota bacterium]|nr:nitrogenase component 1 [Elusimicrobiota bacterium]